MDRGNDPAAVKTTLPAWLRFSLLGAALLLALALSPLRPLKIDGSSMEPTMRNGETYVLDQFYWKLNGLQLGDVVVLEREDGDKWVKRLIGLPGDVLQIGRDEFGWIRHVANITRHPDQRLQDAYLEERTVQPGEIFIIGDNLNRSSDSTNQEAGAFKLTDVIGVARTFTMRRSFPFRKHL